MKPDQRSSTARCRVAQPGDRSGHTSHAPSPRGSTVEVRAECGYGVVAKTANCLLLFHCALSR